MNRLQNKMDVLFTPFFFCTYKQINIHQPQSLHVFKMNNMICNLIAFYQYSKLKAKNVEIINYVTLTIIVAPKYQKMHPQKT
jgi:hypothetical protein